MPKIKERGSLCSYLNAYIVTCLLKTGMAEPEELAIARLWLGKHVSLATDMHSRQWQNCWNQCLLWGPPHGYIPGTKTDHSKWQE
jgi:hypothetical protein